LEMQYVFLSWSVYISLAWREYHQKPSSSRSGKETE
jgi:hypothetical protein